MSGGGATGPKPVKKETLKSVLTRVAELEMAYEGQARLLKSATDAVEVAYKQLEKAMDIPDEKQAEFNTEVEDVKDRLLHWLERHHGDYIRDGDGDPYAHSRLW